MVALKGETPIIAKEVPSNSRPSRFRASYNPTLDDPLPGFQKEAPAGCAKDEDGAKDGL